MNALKDRLASLRRQAGISPPPLIPTDDVRARLGRLLGTRDRSVRRVLPAPVGEQTAMGVFAVEHAWPAESTVSIQLPWLEASIDRERLVCFDTETTGLAGGVGTKAFMIGWAMWCSDHIVTRQLYLTTMGGEDAMLRQFSAALPRDPVFVSYNGKSYDAPLLKGRYRINRQTHPFDDNLHIDLLHPTRRRYRGVWENCKLKTIERELLGILREDDLPGSEAPAAWRDFLQGRCGKNLARVVEHNRQDVLTLTRLLDHLRVEQ
ncbi:MAG: ribonuclease H-like domain-containing protein [Rudaea sp.]